MNEQMNKPSLPQILQRQIQPRARLLPPCQGSSRGAETGVGVAYVALEQVEPGREEDELFWFVFVCGVACVGSGGWMVVLNINL